jgi:hypothetical protein
MSADEIILISAIIASLLIGAIATYALTRMSVPIYLHKKTGNCYMVLTNAKLEGNLQRVVVYARSDELEDTTVWVRDYNEFHDGRFQYMGRVFK